MKKVSILITFIICSLLSFSQAVVQRASGSNTVKDVRWMAGLNAYLPIYADTASANITGNIGIDSTAAVIYTRDVKGFWFRQCCPKHWVQFQSNISGCEGLQSGGIVSWDSLFVFDCTSGVFCLGGQTYNFAQGVVTLANSDLTNPRFDIIGVDTTGTLFHITGTPSPSPVVPISQVDFQSQLILAIVRIDAGSSSAGGQVSQLIYDENVGQPTEWVTSGIGSPLPDPNNTKNPYHLTKAIQCAQFSQLFNYSDIHTTPTPVNISSTYNVLKQFIYINSPFGTKSNLSVTLYSGSTAVAMPLDLSNAQGFNKSLSKVYQNVSIPLSDFTYFDNFTGFIDGIRYTPSGSNADSFYIDYITLNGGTGGLGNGNAIQNVFRKDGTDSVFQTTVSNATRPAFVPRIYTVLVHAPLHSTNLNDTTISETVDTSYVPGALITYTQLQNFAGGGQTWQQTMALGSHSNIDASLDSAKILVTPSVIGSTFLTVNRPVNYTGGMKFNGLIENTSNGNGTYNSPVKLGFNINGVENAAYGGNWLSMEPDYEPGGALMKEFHYAIFHPTGAQEIRLFSSTYRQYATVALSTNNWDFRGGSFDMLTLPSRSFASFTGEEATGNWKSGFHSPTGVAGVDFLGTGVDSSVSIASIHANAILTFDNWKYATMPNKIITSLITPATSNGLYTEGIFNIARISDKSILNFNYDGGTTNYGYLQMDFGTGELKHWVSSGGFYQTFYSNGNELLRLQGTKIGYNTTTLDSVHNFVGSMRFNTGNAQVGYVWTAQSTGGGGDWAAPSGGTVRSVAALTLGTSGTDLTSTVANPTTTPAITLQVPTASATNRGALSAADWSTFNSKGSGTVTSVSGTTNRITSTGGTTPVIDISAVFEALLGKVASPLSQFASTTSSQLAGVISDETGTGALVFANSPAFTTPNIGSAIGSISGNAGTATILATGRTISGTGEATFTTGAFNGSANATAAVTLSNAAVIGKVLTAYTPGAGTVSSTDNILQAIQKIDGNQQAYTPPVLTGTANTITFYDPSGNLSNGDPDLLWDGLILSIVGTVVTDNIINTSLANPGGVPVVARSDGKLILGTDHTGTPTITAGAGAGTTPTVSISTGSTETSFQINVTTGTLPTGTGATIATVTFPVGFSSANFFPVISAANGTTALLSGATMVYIVATSATTANLICGTSALTGATAYKFNVDIAR